ncbi:hypothetical protein [Delftia acidovorans]|uniref:Uncharacterized protein n=1 Tax=Delftia acidovorans TaxID=80866 RepID=A0AAJ2VCH0_DELAC|nr:hypothetical protein [Delftia acidovorans]MDX4957271.1 hypothetical protein [Delftia acidovorans]
MTKHTPGPWEWWTSNSFRRLSSAATGNDGDVLYATVQPSDGHPDVELPNGGWNGPDGRLIAAAPELLEVALAALEDVMSIENEHSLSPDVGRKLRAAIDKATGATP